MPTFIEFVYIGQMDNKPMRQLYISTHKLNLELTKDQNNRLVQRLRALNISMTTDIKERYINEIYNLTITDERSYRLLNFFISRQKYLYTDFFSTNDSDDFAIVIGNQNFRISKKTESEFFQELKKFLKSRKCDKNLIIQISQL